uniref:Uncharacterized protein n=1 Tax=Daucus carota subsp. sativus TaxID=79200 RepID=A0A161WW33_DAUCS
MKSRIEDVTGLRCVFQGEVNGVRGDVDGTGVDGVTENSWQMEVKKWMQLVVGKWWWLKPWTWFC